MDQNFTVWNLRPNVYENFVAAVGRLGSQGLTTRMLDTLFVNA